MIEEPVNSEPLSSFQVPTAVPTSDPDVGIFHYAFWNDEYTPLILGCLLQLLQTTTWNTTTDAANELAVERCLNLINQVSVGVDVFSPGMIIEYGGATAPDGWLICDGSAVSRSTFSELFAVVSTSFGLGDGSTTFNLPNMKGRSPIGIGTASGLSTRSMGDTGGEEAHQLVTSEIPSHSHSDSGHAHSIPAFITTGTAVIPPIDDGFQPPIITSSSGVGFASIQNTGGDGNHNNMQPFLAVNFIIRATRG